VEQLYRPFAVPLGCSVDALRFVLDSFELAKYSAPRTVLWGVMPITSLDLCRAFRRHAMEHFNHEAEAVELLAEWGLRSSEDLGRIVFGLVEQGFFKPTGDDRIEDFNGIFTLVSLFAKPI